MCFYVFIKRYIQTVQMHITVKCGVLAFDIVSLDIGDPILITSKIARRSYYPSNAFKTAFLYNETYFGIHVPEYNFHIQFLVHVENNEFRKITGNMPIATTNM